VPQGNEDARVGQPGPGQPAKIGCAGFNLVEDDLRSFPPWALIAFATACMREAQAINSVLLESQVKRGFCLPKGYDVLIQDVDDSLHCAEQSIKDRSVDLPADLAALRKRIDEDCRQAAKLQTLAPLAGSFGLRVSNEDVARRAQEESVKVRVSLMHMQAADVLDLLQQPTAAKALDIFQDAKETCSRSGETGRSAMVLLEGVYQKTVAAIKQPGERDGASDIKADDVALCRCSCGALLKVLNLPAGSSIKCPSCSTSFPKPSEGPHAESLYGTVFTVMVAARTLLQNAPIVAPQSVCDHCHTPTPRRDGFVSSREMMLRSDLASLFPRMANVKQLRASSPSTSNSGLIDAFRDIVAADPKPWLLCNECASIVFSSGVRNLLSVNGAAESWNRDGMPPEIRDFFPDYQRGLPGEVVDAEGAS
jgi:hypothetical protein